jgi:hypothetical protein
LLRPILLLLKVLDFKGLAGLAALYFDEPPKLVGIFLVGLESILFAELIISYI